MHSQPIGGHLDLCQKARAARLCRLVELRCLPSTGNVTFPRRTGTQVEAWEGGAGGPTIYLGRDMKLSHKGMGITKDDYAAFMRCLSATLDVFEVPEPERGEVIAFITSLNRA